MVRQGKWKFADSALALVQGGAKLLEESSLLLP
jgi:hypothetical protein